MAVWFLPFPNVAQVPARIEKLIAEKQFYAAVQLHAQSTLMLEREGLQTVGALQDVRSELTKLRGIIFYKILEDLHAHLYNKGEYSSAASSIHERDDEVPTTTAVAFSMNSSQPLSRRTRLLKGDNQFGVLGLGDGYRPGSIDGGSSFDGHDEEGALELHDEATLDGYNAITKVNGGDGSQKDIKIVSHQIPPWLSYATPDEFLESMKKSDAPLHVKYLQTMVECLCMLGKVAAAGAMICCSFLDLGLLAHQAPVILLLDGAATPKSAGSSMCFYIHCGSQVLGYDKVCHVHLVGSQRLRPTIHEIITSKIKAHAELVNSTRSGICRAAHTATTGLHYLKGQLESYQSPKQKRQNGISLAGTLLAVSPVSPVMAPAGTAQTAAKELLDSIWTLLFGYLNHVVVGELLESKGTQVDMNTPKSVTVEVNWNHDSEASQVTGGYSIGFSLTVLQVAFLHSVCKVNANNSYVRFCGQLRKLHLQMLLSKQLDLQARLLPKKRGIVPLVSYLTVPSDFPPVILLLLSSMLLFNKTMVLGSANQNYYIIISLMLMDYRDRSEDGLTFAFRFTDATISVPNQGVDLIRQGWTRRGPNVLQEGYGSAAILPEQGIYLAASIYRPVIQFTDKIASMLPKKYSQLG
ncbi:Exocyst complex component SEC8 [Vitis vinifera]|uniref:Exocyst complex component Sec8 n=1 Tax=Vitis vinifera TaxID=29760 RepID=A0A438ILS2_VITVI|nr:Exocyst complex component SEC8 [Vitis vinifera]